MPEARPPNPPYPIGALPIGTRLGEFEIRRVLGVGGFGIVYQAFDHLLEREVALKEYMPSSLVERNETMHVSLISQANADTFALGLRSFVNEARLLARFDHPSLVKVHRFWEANGTAYMAMALYKGRTVRDVRLEHRARPDEAWVRNILEPLLGAIEKLHGEDVYHRDIAPDNILIEADGHPVLLDFGAARRVISDRSQALTAILKPSYAPIEQYADVSGMKQGPWTDIYALGATVHFLLLGKPPPPAPGRSIQDTMPPLAGQDLAGCSKPFLELVDWMLSPLPTDRPQSVAVVRDALAGRIRPPSSQPPSAFERTMPLEGPPGHDQATVVIPRGQTQLPPVGRDEATVIVPRSGSTGLNSSSTRAMPPPPTVGAAPARAALPDDDATVVKPIQTYQTQRPTPPQPTRAMPPPADPPAYRTQQVPPTTRQSSPVTQHQAPPPTAPVASAAGKGWLLPVVAGAVVAIGVGVGLWWFLTRPPVPQLVTPPAPPASVAQPESSTPPTSQPVVPAKPEPAPVGAASQAAPPAATAPVVSSPGPSTPSDANAAGKALPTPATGSARTTTPAPKPQPKPAEVAPPRAAETATPALPRATPQPVPASTPAATTATTQSAPAPAPADDGRPKSPSERCAKELPLVRLVCIDLACNRSEFAKHPECIKLREQQQATRRLGEGG